MKRFTLTSLAIGLIGMMMAQSDPGYYYLANPGIGQNPGGLNVLSEEPVGNGLDPSWLVIHNGGATQPEWSPIQNLPFLFYFDGQFAVQYKVSTSGVLTFNTAATAVPSGNNATIPAGEIPDRSVMVWGLKGDNPDDKIVVKLFGDAPNRQLYIMFTSYSYEGGNSFCNMYWSIVLEEGTNNIYLVDQRKTFVCLETLTLGVQMDSKNAVMVDGSPNLGGMAGDNGSPTDNSYFQFTPGQQPRFDLEGLSIDLPDIQELADAPILLKGKFNSLGTETLLSLDLNYQIDNGPVKTMHMSGVPGNLELSHKEPWTPNSIGEYEIKMWVTQPNGETDGKPENDVVSKKVSIIEESPQRKVLIEEATQHNCPPCALYNPPLDAFLLNNPMMVAGIKYVTSGPGANDDPMRLFNQPHHAAMVATMNIPGVPDAIVDGNYLHTNPGNINNIVSASQQRVQEPGLFKIEFDEFQNSNNIELSVDFTTIGNLEGKNLTAHVAVVQDERIYATPTGTNGETDHYFIMRYMVPGPSGTPISGTPGTQITVNGTYASDPEFYSSIIRVVAWVWDDNTREVYMADKSEGIYFCPAGNTMIGTTTTNDASCAGADGSMSVSLSGGSGNYTYLWDDNSTSSSRSNLGAGVYSVTVSDGAGCEFEMHAEVKQQAPPKVVLAPDKTTCIGQDDGKVKAYVSGGNPPYAYSWSNGMNTADIDGLAPGNYFLTVTDNGGCTAALTSATISNPPVAFVQSSSSTPDNGSNNGSATVNAQGGTHPYTYSWDNLSQTGQTASGLSSGMYTVTVSDYNGCAVGTATITVDSNVGLEEDLDAAGISTLELYPNPSQGTFNLEIAFKQAEDIEISLYDLNGKVLHQELHQKQLQYRQSWQLTDLPSGLYTLRIRTSQGAGYKKVIIE